MISCEAFLAELGNYVKDDIAAGGRRQREDHLAHCQTCHVLYDSVRKTLQIVTDSGPFDLPEKTTQLIADKVMSRLRKVSGD